MTDLIARLEAATWGSFDLDLAIRDAVVPKTSPLRKEIPPPYSVSIDAALTLLPEAATWACDCSAPECGVDGTIFWNKGLQTTGTAKTLPLALCIARLRTRQ